MKNQQNQPHTVIDLFRSLLVEDATFCGLYGLHFLKKTDFKPTAALPFEKHQSRRKGQRRHFYTYDEKFECVWKNPFRYLPIIKRFDGAITPITVCITICPLPCRFGTPIATAHWPTGCT